MLYKNNLRAYQLTNKDHIVNNPFCGLFVGMSLGKTISALSAVNELMYNSFEIRKVLVVAPKRVAETVWTDEIDKWAHVKHLKISLVAGSEKQRVAALSANADVYSIGRDNVTWLCNFYGSNLPFDMLIVDESSSFKNPGSLRFKALKLALPSFDRIVILTGTPAPNTLIDLWSQIYLLDKGERLGKFVTHYRNEFFTPNQRNGAVVFNYKLKKESDQKIYDKISDICISMKTKDYTELPDTIINDIKVKFPPALQKQYDEFEKEQILSLDGEDITAVNAAALSTKLLQFANGAIYDEDRKVHEVHTLKLEACKDSVEEAQSQNENVLIAWTYKHDRDRLKQALKIYKPVEISDPDAIKDWNNGKIKVLMMHPASGGHGLNLQFGGHIVIWFGQTWSLELYQQLNARLPRPGQEKAVIINRIIGIETHDTEVVKALEGKDKTQNSLLEAIKAKIKKYKSDKK